MGARNKIQAFLLYLFSFALLTLGNCPNKCSGQGTCDKYSRCNCNAGFKGGDCSLRICPYGSAWSDQATATDTAHASAECSNRGNCDRTSGVCNCMSGFSGNACERLDCSNNCNGNGHCYTMYDYAIRSRDSSSNSYSYSTPWEAKKIKGCVCDPRFSGYDCSFKDCVKGDDPLTTGQVNEVQVVKCLASSGTFVLYYKGYPTTSIPYSATAAQVQAALRSITLLSGVKVTFSISSGTACQLSTNLMSITFAYQFGSQSPLTYLMDSTMSSGGGLMSISADGITSFTDSQNKVVKSVKGTKENSVCAGRGSCSTDGTCACYSTNGDSYGSSNGYGSAGVLGDCGYIVSGSTVATCPGQVQCSGHGLCSGSSTYTCSCDLHWTGGDCSERTCPSGLSWFDYPSSNNVAHQSYVACSNAGLCDKTTGKCTCNSNFYGQACEFMACGGGLSSPCNAHGRCMTMAELAIWAEKNGDATSYTYGKDPNNALTWDGNRVQGCLCDKGHHGYDCTLLSCPAGDDPGTYDDHTEVQLLQCTASSGTFTLTFRQQTTASLYYNATAAHIQSALMALSSLSTLRVIFTQDQVPDFTILNYTKPGAVPPEGQPLWGSFQTVKSKIGRSFKVLANVTATTLKVYDSSALVVGQGLSGPGIFPNTMIRAIVDKTVTLSHPTVYQGSNVNVTVTNFIQPKGRDSGTEVFLENNIPSDLVSATPTGFCNIDGDQIAVVSFDTTHGDLPSMTADASNLVLVNALGVTKTATIEVFNDGETVDAGSYTLSSIQGTTEVAVCNNRGICDETTGECNCFPTWSSSDGQGGPGNMNDCGYRNAKLYSSFNSEALAVH